MSLLAIYKHPASPPAAGQPGQPRLRQPELITSEADLIARELGKRGIRFQRWPARASLPAEADAATILAAYADEVAQVQAVGDYPTVDVILLRPDHPDRQALRQKFLAEHTHSEDEVRFFVEGEGLFCLHIGEEVLQVVCQADDWIAVPAGTRHWFDMGPEPKFCVLRFFHNPEGWVAQFSGDPIADHFPLLDQLQALAD